MGTPNWLPPVELALYPEPPPARPLSQPPPPLVLPAIAAPKTGLKKPSLMGLETIATAEKPEAPEAPEAPHKPTTPQQTRKNPVVFPLFPWFLAFFTLFLAGAILRDLFLYLQMQWQTYWGMGLFFSVLATALLTVVLVAISRDVGHFWRLHQLTRLRRHANDLIHKKTFGQTRGLTLRLAEFYRHREGIAATGIAAKLNALHDSVADFYSDAALLERVSDHILPPIDDEAYKIIVRHATATTLLTALSPLAWLDALFFLWRNVRMVREVAQVYGTRPGFFGSLVLLRQTVAGVAAAGATDWLVDSASESLGESVATVVLARAGQGLASGLLLARIGMQAMRECRPVPFTGQKQPRLSRVRQEMLKAVKNAIGKKSRPMALNG